MSKRKKITHADSVKAVAALSKLNTGELTIPEMMKLVEKATGVSPSYDWYEDNLNLLDLPYLVHTLDAIWHDIHQLIDKVADLSQTSVDDDRRLRALEQRMFDNAQMRSLEQFAGIPREVTTK